jgi:SAM-dependent methyltransferase
MTSSIDQSPSLGQGYTRYYEEAHFIPQQSDERELDRFASLLPSTEKRTVLDLGCAEGKLALRLTAAGHTVVAVDISAGQLAQAAAAARAQGLDLETIQCDIETDPVPLAGRQFDYVFFMDVLEHLRSPIAGLENIHRLTADTGRLIIHTPNASALHRWLRYIIYHRKLVDYARPGSLFDFHLQIYDYLSLEKVLCFAGFKIIQVHPTQITLPLISRLKIFNPFLKLLAWLFPFLGDNLLVVCRKRNPLDVAKLIADWRRTL